MSVADIDDQSCLTKLLDVGHQVISTHTWIFESELSRHGCNIISNVVANQKKYVCSCQCSCHSLCPLLSVAEDLREIT